MKFLPEKVEDPEYLKELLFAINTAKYNLHERYSKDKTTETPINMYEKVKFGPLENKVFEEPKEVIKVFSNFNTSLPNTMISLKMKVMENFAAFFSKLNEQECINMENTLVETIKTRDEPHISNAIRCLQTLYYCHFYVSNRYCTKVKYIANIILYRILEIGKSSTWTECRNIEISDHSNIEFKKIYYDDTDKYLETEQKEFKLRHINDDLVLTSTDIKSTEEQIIINLMLLNYIIPELLMTDFLKNSHFIEMILRFMNPKYAHLDYVLCINLSILRKCLDNNQFREMFIKRCGIERLIRLSSNSISQNNVIHCFEIISCFESSMILICQDDPKIIPKMVQSVLEILKSTKNSSAIQTLKNVLEYQDFFQNFVSLNGFLDTLSSIKNASWFVTHATSTHFSTVFSCSKKNRMFMIEALEYVLSYWIHCFYNNHFLMNKRSILFSNNKRIDLNIDGTFEEIVHFLKTSKDSNNNFLDKRYLYELSYTEFISWLAGTTLKFARVSEHRLFSKLTKYCTQLIYVVSLFEETHHLLFKSFTKISPVFGEGTSIMHCLQRMLSKCLRVCDPPYIYIFKTYINILRSYCIDDDTFQKYLFKNEYVIKEIYSEKNFKNIQFLINTDLLFHCLYLTTFETSYYYNLDIRLECFKCLYLICGHFSACEMISKFHEYFTKEIPGLFEDLKIAEINTVFYNEMHNYTDNLIRRINHYFLKSYKTPDRKINEASLVQICERLAALGYDETVEKFKQEIQKKFPDRSNKTQIYEVPRKTFPCSIKPNNIISTKKYIYHNFNHSGRIYPNHTFNISKLNDYSNTSLQKYYKLRGYDLFYGSNYYAGHPIQTENEADLTYAKYLNDDKIAISTANGFIVYSQHYKKLQDIWSALKIHYIQQSKDNSLLLGCGVEEYGNYSTHVWPYDKKSDKFNLSPSVEFPDTMHAIFSNSSKNLYAVNKEKVLKAFDVETGSSTGTLNDPDNVSFYFQNYIDITYNDKLLYYNGSLFDTNEKSLIHTFPKFNTHFSGVFLPSERQILINTQLWDIRTFKLVDVLSQFENTQIFKTFNDEIMYGITYEEEEVLTVHHKFDQIYNRSNQPAPKYMQFFDTSHFNPLGKQFNLVNNVFCVDVNTKATKYLTVESLSHTLSQDVKSISVWEYAPKTSNMGKIDNFFVDAVTFLHNQPSLTDDSNDEASFIEDSPDENYDFANDSDFETVSEGQSEGEDEEDGDDDDDEDYEDVEEEEEEDV